MHDLLKKVSFALLLVFGRWALAVPSGSYDGSYDPASGSPPPGQSTWIKTELGGLTIQPNQPEAGQATFHDSKASPPGQGSVLGIRRVHPSADWPQTASKTEYEIHATFSAAVPSISAALPSVQLGFRDEGGQGRVVALGFFRPAPEKYEIHLLNASMNSAVKLADFVWADGQMHTYVLRKQMTQGKMRVTLEIDGQPAKTGADYASLSEDVDDKQGFQMGTLSPTSVKVILDEIRYGPLGAEPPATAPVNPGFEQGGQVPVGWELRHFDGAAGQVQAANDAALEGQRGVCVVKTNDGGACELVGSPVAVVDRRFHEATAWVQCDGLDTGQTFLKVTQYKENSNDVDKPDFAASEETGQVRGKFHQIRTRFYTRDGSRTIRLHLVSSGGAGRVCWDQVALSGNTEYQPPSEPPQVRPPGDLEAAKRIVAARKSSEARIVAVDGRNRLVIDGQMVPPAFAASAGTITLKAVTDWFRDAGVHVHVRQIMAEGYTPLVGKVMWTGPQQYNFDRVDEQLWRVLRDDPSGYVILNVAVDPYAKWGEEHPDDVVMNHLGEKGLGQHHLLRWGGEPGDKYRYLPSLYSKRLREDISQMLRALVEHIESSEAGKAVIGYCIEGGNDMQWVNWAHWDLQKMDDYSPAAQEAFREFVRREYNNDEAALRRSWRNPEITFATVQIPTPERRRGKGLFIDWRTDQDVADFNRFYSEAPVEFMDALAQVIKERTGGKKTVQIYCAGPMTSAPSATCLGRLLRSQWIDLTQAPSDYWIRLPGYPGGVQGTLESMALHGKIYLTEQDWRSFTVASGGEGLDFTVGRAPDAAAHNAMVRRESGNVLARGQGTWWLDLQPDSYANQKIMDGVAEARRAFERDLQNKGRPEADVAFFISERGLDYLGQPTGNSFRWFVMRRSRDKWDSSGVPYHLYLQSDLTDASLPKYKVYIFLTPYHFTEQERAQIDQLKRDGNTLVFLHAPGMVGANDAPAAISQVTGIRVRDAGLRDYIGTYLSGTHPLQKDLAGNFGDKGIPGTYPARSVSGPAWEVVDADAQPLAYYAGTKKVAWAARDFGTWKSVYCGIPRIEAQFLNNLAGWSGAWVAAAPFDAVFASQHFATIHALAPGAKTLYLRYPSRVTDLTTGQIVTDRTQQLELNMEFGQTRWFALEPLP